MALSRVSSDVFEPFEDDEGDAGEGFSQSSPSNLAHPAEQGSDNCVEDDMLYPQLAVDDIMQSHSSSDGSRLTILAQKGLWWSSRLQILPLVGHIVAFPFLLAFIVIIWAFGNISFSFWLGVPVSIQYIIPLTLESLLAVAGLLYSNVSPRVLLFNIGMQLLILIWSVIILVGMGIFYFSVPYPRIRIGDLVGVLVVVSSMVHYVRILTLVMVNIVCSCVLLVESRMIAKRDSKALIGQSEPAIQ